MRNTKRLITLSIMIFLLICLGFFVVNYLNSKQKLSITFDNGITGVKATLYRVNKENRDRAGEFLESKVVNIKKGDYVLVTSENEDYATQELRFALGDKPETVNVNPAYSDNKLNDMLVAEKTTLVALISSAFPGVISGYDISEGKLYEHGDWYGTTLRPRLTDEQKRLSYIDVYRLVAHKEAVGWKIVTSQPELIVNIKDYPEIPRDILVDLNKQY